MTLTKERSRVSLTELPVLVGKLDFLKGMVAIERELDSEASYRSISPTMEQAIIDCSNIADRLLYAGLEETT